MGNVYLRVSTNGMPKDTLRSILNNLHGAGNKPLLAREPIAGNWYVRFDDNAGATRTAVASIIESMFVDCAPVACLPGGKTLSRQQAAKSAAAPQQEAPIFGGFLGLFDTPEVAAARARSDLAMYNALTRAYEGMGRPRS